MKIFSIIFSIIIITGTCLQAGDYIRLGADSILVNTDNFDLVFHIERTCPNPSMIMGASNGFVITATGSATYQHNSVYQDPGSSINWNLGGLFVTESMDGTFPDTILIGGAAIPPAGGMPIIFDEPYFHIIIDIGPGEGGLCFDSAFVYAAGTWTWSGLTCGQGGAANRPLFVDKYGNDFYHPICITIYKEPALCGDTNCDGSVNVADAVWIINYVFAGGKGPCDTSGDGLQDCY